jgi:hypothetical protein
MSITLRKEVLSKYMNSVFIETGTFKGGGVRLALECGFSRIFSIEVDPTLYTAAVEEFKPNHNVCIILGDSIKKLPELLLAITDPITFWLDAHIQESKVIGEVPIPLLLELDLLATFRKGMLDTVLVDDRRCFNSGWHWMGITENDVVDKLNATYPSNEVCYADSNAAPEDIIISYHKKPSCLQEFIEDNQDNPKYSTESDAPSL